MDKQNQDYLISMGFGYCHYPEFGLTEYRIATIRLIEYDTEPGVYWNIENGQCCTNLMQVLLENDPPKATRVIFCNPHDALYVKTLCLSDDISLVISDVVPIGICLPSLDIETNMGFKMGYASDDIELFHLFK